MFPELPQKIIDGAENLASVMKELKSAFFIGAGCEETWRTPGFDEHMDSIYPTWMGSGKYILTTREFVE